MNQKIVLALLVQCTFCFAIRVPVDWENDSEVKDEQLVKNNQKPETPIYNEYFQYLAKKPQFAIDIAAAHGVKSPENHFKSYPIRPYTGVTKPVLGQRAIINSNKNTHQPFQQLVQHSNGLGFAHPVATSFEVYHPYIVEQPALQGLYKDPVLDKIRYDLRENNNRFKQYENEAGQSNINKDEYLETPQQIDRKKNPHRNNPTQFEIHRPQHRPLYYRVPSRPNNREQLLNHKLRHPWNQNIAKVTPNHYHPVKNHLSQLRQQHALKFDDERNEYPQLPPLENYEEKPDGFDIFEKGTATYEKLRKNVGATLNKVEQENRPNAYQLEQQNDDLTQNQDEEEFVPIKNYAQVRKTETTKHLPKTAAFRDAESLEEIENAPRLREAIKSSKAQVVYSEEGYEDAAYDHAGEQKHASDHEHHGGYLKENEISGGKYKTPSVNAAYSDAKGSALREQLLHGEKWEDDKKENQDEIESNDYSENDGEHEIIGDIANALNIEAESERNKRDSTSLDIAVSSENILNKDENDTINKNRHDVIKRETSIKVPDFDFNSTLPSKDDIEKLSKVKAKPQKIKIYAVESEEIKYPYYSNNFKTLNKNSPLRYAENIKLIPKKSRGGTEFYDSRSRYDCPEVEEDVDPIPEKLKKAGHPDDEDSNSDDADKIKGDKFSSLKTKQRLRGLGDKIDCFKAKYFGENPLDSPFFKEDIIENPEPITKPNLKVFKRKQTIGPSGKLLHYKNDRSSVLDKTPMNHKKNNQTLLMSKSKTNTDLYGIINEDRAKNMKIINVILNSNETTDPSNVIYKHFENIKDITKPLPKIRKRRATTFMYEPYKIIRDSQVQDSKKTTTTSNISPLIKQLQSSRVIDKVNANTDKEQAIKKNTKIYKDIGKTDRQNIMLNAAINDSNTVSFVDVNSDKRRGEPRYELRSIKNKASSTPIETKQLLSIEGNKTQNNNDKKDTTARTQIKRSKLPKTTIRPYFDVSKYLPQSLETQHIAASNTVQKIIRTTTPETPTKSHQNFNHDDEDEEYDEYEDEEEQIDTTTTTTTTTKRPSIRKRTRGTTTTTTSTTTTIKPIVVENERELNERKLRVSSRIRNSPSIAQPEKHLEDIKEPLDKSYSREENPPKYTEKKRKSTKSTLVTDTKTYGNDDDDTTRKEVDALLRVKQDMNEYMPNYEKEHNKYSKYKDENEFDSEDEDDDEDEDEDDEDDDDEEVDDDDDDDNDDEQDNDKYNHHKNHSKEDEENENAKHEKEKSELDEEHEDGHNHRNNKKNRLHITTSEPTKRTLVRTTFAPPTTTETRSARIELKPTVLKKKIEIHEETPINRSSPHVTQFKQDIKEIEIIKETPPQSRKKIHKKLEALDLYRDENLAEEINKLGDIEVFRENLDLKSGPKHGGNYRSITPEELQREKDESKSEAVKNKDDVETSQTETKKHVKLNDVPLNHRESFASSSSSLPPNNEARNAKIIEFSDSEETMPKAMHGGNLKFSRNKASRQNKKSEKLIEFDDDEDDDDTSRMHGGNFRSYGNRNSGRPMHGGNYKSAKIIQAEETTIKPTRGKTRDSRTSAAITSLNGFARAAPILTSTPAFILDPSKRMYYYVDA